MLQVALAYILTTPWPAGKAGFSSFGLQNPRRRAQQFILTYNHALGQSLESREHEVLSLAQLWSHAYLCGQSR